MNQQRRHHPQPPSRLAPLLSEIHAPTKYLIRAIAIFAAAVLAIPLLQATAHAAPSSESVHYRLSGGPTSMSLSVADGTIAREGSDLVIKNGAGKALFRMALWYRDEYLEYPIDAQVTPTSATLVPSKDKLRAHLVDPVHVNAMRAVAAKATPQKQTKQTKQQRDDEALTRFNGQLSAGMTISSLVGLTVGAIIGGAIGCAIGAVAAGIGCIVPGIEIGATLGSIVGIILGGGGTLILSAIQYFQTINSPV